MATGITANLSLPYPLPTDQVNVSGDIEQLAIKMDNIFEEETQDIAAAMWSGGEFSNGLLAPTYDDTTGKMSMSLTQDIQTTASPQFVSLTLTGDITTTSTSFNLLNTIVETLNFATQATTINVGSSSSVSNFGGDINLSSGKSFKINNVEIINETSIASSVVSSSLTSVGTITSGTWSATEISVDKGGTGLTSIPTNGQILIGNGSGYSLSSLTAGSGINIVNDSGSITIEASTTFTLPDQTGNSGKFLFTDGSVESWSFVPQSSVTDLVSDLALKAPLDSPSFSGTPTAPTASSSTSTTQIATTEFVSEKIDEEFHSRSFMLMGA